MFIQRFLLFCAINSIFFSCQTYPWWRKTSQKSEEHDDGKNKNINNISISTTVNSSSSSQIVDTVVSAVKDEVEQIRQQVSASVEMIALLTKDLIWEYKWRIGFIGSATGYCLLVFKNNQLKKYITDPQRWHFWSLTHLMPRLYKKELSNDATWQLIREIQSRYTNAYQPDDFILPFMRFIKAIEDEIVALEKYQRLGKLFQYLGISQYVFFDQEVYKKCNLWLEEAKTIKSLFLCWMADYKLQQHIRSLHCKLILLERR